MKTRYPPLDPLTEADGDPRAAFAASLLEALKAPPTLAPGVAARIELQLTRATSVRTPDSPWLARFAPAGAPALGVLLAVSGSAIAAYRVPAVARGIQRLMSEVAGWTGEMGRRPVPPHDALPAHGTEAVAAPLAVAGQSTAPAPVTAPVTSAASAVASRKSRRRPPSPSVAASSSPAAASTESAELERAFAEKRQGRLEIAESLFRAYRTTHPSGSLASEAALGQLDVEIALGHVADALGLLDLLCDDRSAPRWRELRVLRAELLSQSGQCAQALATFGESLESPALAERALYGRAICLQRLGRLDESRRAFREFLERHPSGSRAAQARLALGLTP